QHKTDAAAIAAATATSRFIGNSRFGLDRKAREGTANVGCFCRQVEPGSAEAASFSQPCSPRHTARSKPLPRRGRYASRFAKRFGKCRYESLVPWPAGARPPARAENTAGSGGLNAGVESSRRADRIAGLPTAIGTGAGVAHRYQRARIVQQGAPD